MKLGIRINQDQLPEAYDVKTGEVLEGVRNLDIHRHHKEALAATIDILCFGSNERVVTASHSHPRL